MLLRARADVDASAADAGVPEGRAAGLHHAHHLRRRELEHRDQQQDHVREVHPQVLVRGEGVQRRSVLLQLHEVQRLKQQEVAVKVEVLRSVAPVARAGELVQEEAATFHEGGVLDRLQDC